MKVEVGKAGEALQRLPAQIAVWHRMANDHHPPAGGAQDAAKMAGGLRFAAAGAHGADRKDRAMGGQHGAGGAEQNEIGAGSGDQRRLVHDLAMGDVAVGENHLPDTMAGDQPRQLRFGENRNPLWVAAAGQFRRVEATGNIGDLRGGKSHHPDGGIVPIENIEIVKVAAGRAHDDERLHGSLLFSHYRSGGMPSTGRRSSLRQGQARRADTRLLPAVPRLK